MVHGRQSAQHIAGGVRADGRDADGGVLGTGLCGKLGVAAEAPPHAEQHAKRGRQKGRLRAHDTHPGLPVRVTRVQRVFLPSDMWEREATGVND